MFLLHPAGVQILLSNGMENGEAQGVSPVAVLYHN